MASPSRTTSCVVEGRQLATGPAQPALLEADIRSYLRRRTATPNRSSADAGSCRRRWSPRCAGIKEDDLRAGARRAVRLSLEYRQGGQQLIGRTPRDGGDDRIILDGDALAKASDISISATRSIRRPSPRSLERRSRVLGVFHHPRAKLAGAARTCRISSSKPAAASCGVAI